MEGAEELSLLHFNHANEHISLGLKGSISKRNGLISVYSYYPFVESLRVIQAHGKAFSVWHCIASLKLDRAILSKSTLMWDKQSDNQGLGHCARNVNELRAKRIGNRVC